MPAMGVPPEHIDGSIRVSLSGETTEEEIRAFAAALPQIIHSLGRR